MEVLQGNHGADLFTGKLHLKMVLRHGMVRYPIHLMPILIYNTTLLNGRM